MTSKRDRGRRRGRSRRLPAEVTRRFPRSARVNEVLREVLAETLERLADKDERLTLLTVTAVTSDSDLRRATVMFSSLNQDAQAALEAARPRLQGAIAEQVRLKRTPQLSFTADPAVSTGQRVEEILRQVRGTGSGDDDGRGPDDR